MGKASRQFGSSVSLPKFGPQKCAICESKSSIPSHLPVTTFACEKTRFSFHCQMEKSWVSLRRHFPLMICHALLTVRSQTRWGHRIARASAWRQRIHTHSTRDGSLKIKREREKREKRKRERKHREKEGSVQTVRIIRCVQQIQQYQMRLWSSFQTSSESSRDAR